jgi:hypothetical protein
VGTGGHPHSKAGPEGWSRTAAQENARYRETVLMTQLTRAATAAGTFAARVVGSSGDFDEHFVDLLQNVRDQIAEDLAQHEDSTEYHHAAYLAPGFDGRIRLGRDLENKLVELLDLVRSSTPDEKRVAQLTGEISDLSSGLSPSVSRKG